ncbi:MAG: hypothetical protein GXY08_14380 [Ruminococcus sp.]|nr:hypothetical protein [Ruminococcus sp.]
MKMILAHKIKSALAGLVAGSMLATAVYIAPEDNSVPQFEVNAASLCTVNTNKTYQIIRGFGGMNHPEWQNAGAGHGDMTASEVQTAFGNGANELGLTVLRIFVSDDQNAWKNAVPTAKRAQALGATVFATPWNPPASMRSNGSGGANGGKYVLNNGAEAQYAKYLNDYVKYMEGQGINLYSISVQNEPDYAMDWTAWSPDRTTNFIANYGQAIKEGTNAKLMSPESFQYGPESYGYGKNYYKKIIQNAKAFANCDLFGTHFYGTSRDSMNYPTVEDCGKEIWMTEVYVPNSKDNSANNWPEAIQVAQNIHNGLVVGNMSAYVWWYIRRSYGLMTEDGKISKRGYMMAQYSKYVRPGDYRIDVTEQPASGVYVSAYKHSDTQIEVVAINSGSDVSQEFSISNRTITDVDRYRTTSSENLAATENMEHDTSTFWAQLPANSVSTFVITLESDGKDLPDDPGQPTPREPLQPDSNGYYYHDTFEGDNGEWTGRGSSSVTLSGRNPYKDKEALLIQDRASAWNGAQKTLDSLTFKAGEEYSFSVCAAYLDGTSDQQNLMLSIQYKDSEGTTQYGHIASANAVKGSYVQLANPNYKIPDGATDLILYVESETGTDNFYIDEAIVAVKGTKIEGPKEIKITLGDVDADGCIDGFDLALMRSGLIDGFESYSKAADVNQNRKNDIADAVMLQQYLLGNITEFEKDTTVPDDDDDQPTMTMSEFTKKIQAQMVENEPNDSHNEKSGVQYGTVKSGTYYSTTCKRNKPYNILLPANYDTNKKYPVLYCMHGYWENQDRMIIKGNNTMATRQIIGNAIAEGAAKDMIVVFPYIYSSATQDSCSAMDDANNAAYDNFINDLVKDLMPHIESTYSVKTGRENTAITGFSMGGRESLLIGMKRPDLFGYVGAICPAPGVTGSFKWDSEEVAPYLLMITAGGNDQTVYNTPDGYHQNFTKNNVPHIWHYVNNGYHGDNSIHAHLYNFVRAVFQA